MYECDLGEIILQIILEVDENILSLHRKIPHHENAKGSVGRAVRQRSAKPCTAVQICYRPQKPSKVIFRRLFVSGTLKVGRDQSESGSIDKLWRYGF